MWKYYTASYSRDEEPLSVYVSDDGTKYVAVLEGIDPNKGLGRRYSFGLSSRGAVLSFNTNNCRRNNEG